MLITIFFDSPPQITPAVHKAFAILGGLDLENPKMGYRDLVGFRVKAPRALSHVEVLTVAESLAEQSGVVAGSVTDRGNVGEVALAVSQTADAIAAAFGVESESCSAQEFDPAHATPEDLLYGLLHWSFDGNNLANAEQLRS